MGFSWQVVPKMLAQLPLRNPAKEKAVAEAIFSRKRLEIVELQKACDNG